MSIPAKFDREASRRLHSIFVKLIYNGVDLAQLGVFRILSHTTQREPADHPQWERVSYRVRLDFFEQTFQDNLGLVRQLQAALKTQQAQLLWQDDNGANYLNRTVTAGDDESADEGLNRGGTRWQAVVFTFWFYQHDVAANALQAFYTRSASGAPDLSLDAVTGWSERLAITRWDDLRDARKLVQGTVAAAGRLRADTTQGLELRRQALLAVKDRLIAELQGQSGRLRFGTFDRVVRVTEFKAEIDQPSHGINWSLTAVYTVFPNEADYAVLEVRIARRENLAEGVKYLSLTGKIGAPTIAAARTRLALLQGALVPAGYVMLAREDSEPHLRTESGGATGDQGDGAVSTELSFTLEYRDTSSLACTYKRTGVNTPTLDMGTIDKFRDSYSAQLFDDLRSIRRRAGGVVTIGGKWYAGEELSDAARQAALTAKKVQMDAELTGGAQGALIYGAIFNQTVRPVDFNADINRLRNCVEWSLTAAFTRFPSESNYVLCDINVGVRQDRQEGTKTLTLAGRIGAASQEAAQAKLAALRAALVPVGYVLKLDGTDARRVSSESGGNPVDGEAFIELTVNDEWQSAAGNVLLFKLRRADDDDARTGFLRTTFSGTVQASGSTAVAAFLTARTKAAELGDNKYPFRVRTSVVEVSNLVQTGGAVLVTVEFSYEYQRKGDRIYTEVTAELSEDTFGNTVEAVSGFIAASTLALAQTTYQNDIRNTASYAAALLLSERRPTQAEQRLDSPLTRLATVEDRFPFHFTVLRPKLECQTAASYEITTSCDVQALERRTIVQGEVFAANEAVAEAFLTTLLTGLGIGKRLRYDRRARYQRGPKVSGGGVSQVLVALSFQEEYEAGLTGVAGVLECECSEDVVYSGARLVAKPIPDGPSIIQRPGIVEGRRTVSARAIAATETAAATWVRTIRTALLDGAHELPPQVATRFVFLRQTAGVPRGAEVNVKLVEVNATFGELLPDHPFSQG